ncbi:MAG: hypothetical protein JSV49_09245 [Thermoplasmata archaeon]|nr:MAG: hypothetical protein JSV49_09245 [Thermoplasmata archaeon]
MNKESLLAILDQLISELIESNKTLPAVVEGDRDEASLRILGLTGTILKLNIGLSIFNFCEKLTEYQEVIILTDWDRKGKELREKLKAALIANGIRPNDYYWLGLKHLCSREIQEVEYLHIFHKNLKNKLDS